jgi:transaldolase
MQFFIDTANLSEIREAAQLGIIDGVTTNPTLMSKEGITTKNGQLAHYISICEEVIGFVSAEVLATDFNGMIKEAELLADLHPNIVVKIPMIADGIKAIKYLTEKEIKTNCTLVFSAGQALLAAKAGATFISPFVGRLDDISTDGLQLIAQIRGIFNNYDFSTQILAASIRNPMHVIQCAEIGADVVTAPLNVLLALLKHPLTDIGLAQFLADANKGTSK